MKNLLLINADQLRIEGLGFHGFLPVKTPFLDRLAAQSTVYTHAFTPLPVCSPARQSLLCGRNADSFGAQWNYDFVASPTVQPQWCWTKQLSGKGYQTAYLGRFHVSPTLKPQDFGYDRWVDWSGHKKLLKEKYPDAAFTGGWLGCESPIPYEDAGTHWMADRACETLREFAEGGRPWHIWVDYEEPHLPCRPSKPFSDMYTAQSMKPWPGFADTFEGKPYIHRQQTLSWDTAELTWEHDFAPMVARYLAVVSQLDDAIGRILTCLEETGQADNTIVAFTSDHGDMCGSHHMLDKHYVLYDDILRIPLAVRYPGKKPCRIDSFVNNCWDLPASFVEWLGLEKPEVLHGQVLPLSPEENTQPRKDMVCTGNGQQFGLYTTRCLRETRFKYIWNLTDTDELYDLVSDPGETKNLIACPEYEERISAMRKRLFEQLMAQGDPFIRSEWIRRQLLENKKWIR